MNLSASGHEIRLRYPEGVSSTVDASLALTGTRKNAVLSGDVTVTRLGLNPQFDFGAYLAQGNAGARCRGSIRRSTTCTWMCT